MSTHKICFLVVINILISPKNICSGYSLEVPQ